jgi:hypothetical protein
MDKFLRKNTYELPKDNAGNANRICEILNKEAAGHLSEQSYQCIKGEEQRKTKNSPKLERRRWNDGELPEEDSTSASSVQERSGSGGVVGKGIERRRASTLAWSKSTVVRVL